MGSERVRLLAAAGAWLAAGALAVEAGGSARTAVACALLVLAGAAIAWPLTRRTQPAPPLPEPPAAAVDAHRLAALQARLEHLPVAAWVTTSDRLQAVSSRARRLAAPGGVREPGALHRLLRDSTEGGPVVLETERGSERWLLKRQPLALDGEDQVLLVLVPLENELEAESLQAWQQLVQVLTHEIMNSLTPIRSLSQTAQKLLAETDSSDDLRSALDAIERRAGSLATFVATYRRVSQWPAPTRAPVDLDRLLARLQQSVGPDWAMRGGEAVFEPAPSGLRLMADEGQLEQALLALLANAAQATAAQPQPRLWVQARTSRGGRLQISVRDNGPGVPPGLERQIFLPFFSAREGGQGIGLTVARQLVHGMGGRLRHVRPIAGGAAFVVTF